MASVSIIVPSYNHADFLYERLQSINNQTFTDWELIIIDDCSTDESFNILTDFANQNLSKVKLFIVNKSNSGSGYSSWKKGIELAQSKYIWIAETDDFSETTFLEELVAILDKNENTVLAFCGSNYIENNIKIYDSSNRTLDLNVNENEFNIFKGRVLIDKLPFETYITNGSSVVFRNPKSTISDDIFNNKQSSDIFLWTYLVENKSFAFLNKNLNNFRRHENATTVKMKSNSLKSIYSENIKYLNYFNQNDKFQILLNHYIKNYLWYNKSEFFKYNFFKKLKNINFIDFKYFSAVFVFYFNKIKKYGFK